MATSESPPPRSAAWTFGVAVVLYIVVLVFGSVRDIAHLEIILALLQYGLLLGALVWYLRQEKGLPAGVALPRPPLVAVIACFILLAIPLSWFATQGLLNPDESGYSFQARIYRSGKIMVDPLIGATTDVRDTPSELFFTNHILRPSGWFPKFPPGWPLVLSLGYLISARWLANPIFGALQLLVVAAIGGRWFSRKTGLLAALFAALSPFYLINSVGMMSHALCALLGATACLCLSIGLSTGKLRYYAAMFACLAFSLQVRPYTGFVLTAVLSIAALWCTRQDRRQLAQVLAVGVVFGALAIAGVLIYNHVYTGRWLVSPYAEAAGSDTPLELSFSPRVILHGMMRHGPFMLLETLLGSFPFLHLLAGYAIVREQQHRREIWILAAIYVGLVLAYLAHPYGYAVFFGERFHFEAFFALVLLAARGAQLLIERCQTRRAAVALLALGAIQLGQLAFAVRFVSKQGEPYRRVKAAVTSPCVSGLVFLHDSPGFVAKHFNLNDPDWRHAKRIYLVDAEPDQRAAWACRYGFSRWLVASYDPRSRSARIDTAHADCPTVGRP